jgi:rhodanese-related sulfurtransferase
LSQIAEWTPQQLAEELKKGGDERLFMVDVREEHEWEAGRLPGSVHIPLGTLPDHVQEIPKDATPVFICAAGGRSMRAAQFFVQSQGRDAINLMGGVGGWSQVFGAPPKPDEHHHH